MADIKDYNVYISRMQKSVYDKLFFVDKIFGKIDAFLDFGCADGELIKYVHSFMSDVHFIGYDVDEEMIRRAKKNVPCAEFFSDWDEIKCNPETTILNLSSVIHEVYTYQTQTEVTKFWDRVLNTGFKYIVIRDMAYSPTSGPQTKLLKRLYNRIENSEYKDKLADYEAIWGKINDSKNMLHFLLKYKYDENWEREVKENYIPLPVKIYDRMFEKSDYTVEVKRVYTLQYVRNLIREEFGEDIAGISTHMKYILRRKDLK
ncbi:MAG: hypothetical protein II399_01610 [Lachnospiraceae bacterium]|nr:hypothetical protein [Lachnospiraceae bacterium]